MLLAYSHKNCQMPFTTRKKYRFTFWTLLTLCIFAGAFRNAFFSSQITPTPDTAQTTTVTDAASAKANISTGDPAIVEPLSILLQVMEKIQEYVMGGELSLVHNEDMPLQIAITRLVRAPGIVSAE